MNFQHLVSNGKIVMAIVPATDAAGRTSAYVSLKNYHKCFIVIPITQGNAATIALTPVQASAVAGTGSKALSQNCRIWSNLDVATNDTLTSRTAAKSYTTDAGVKNKIVVFEIDPAELDQANGFDCIGFTTGASNVANLTSGVFVLMEPRYPQDVPPTAVTD